MPQACERQTVSFVLRLWSEPAPPPASNCWRGQLEHVGSGQTAHFQVPLALLALLASALRPPIGEPTAGPDSDHAR